LTFLQAVVDDSASDVGDRRLFLAGYLNSAERWALFSDAWGDELKAGRPIHYFRMTEANGLRDEFRGWTDVQRDEKMRGLMRVVRHFKPFSFHVSISRKQNSDVFTPTAPRGLASPHFLCCFGIVSSLSQHIADQNIKTPIEFIFDQQTGVEDDIDLFFDYMKKSLPRKARKLISHRPIFRDDKLYFPLQAADMLAWHLRKNHEVNGSWSRQDSGESLCNPNGHLHGELDVLLPSWADQFVEMPAIQNMQSKSEWRNLKREIRRVTAIGFVPPYGSRLKNLTYPVLMKLKSLLKR
jgi:hypothetical protein